MGKLRKNVLGRETNSEAERACAKIKMAWDYDSYRKSNDSRENFTHTHTKKDRTGEINSPHDEK